MFFAFVAHISDCFSVFLQKFLFVLGIADLTVEQDIQDFIELRSDHLIIHEMGEIWGVEGNFFKTIVVLFVLLL